MRVLIGGGSGFVGQSLSQLLRKRGHKVTIISRKPGEQRITWVDVTKKGLPPCDAVVNLAGENVLNPLRRWTEQFKQEVIASRIETTRTLSEAIAKSESPPHSWVVVTGVGVVLGRNGGALPTMLWPFRLCLGGTVGSGRQPFPWIHIDDLCRLLCHTVEQEEGVGGVLNAVSPSSANDTNADFTRALGKALRRPALFFTPAFAVQLLLGNDRAPMLLEGQRVVPERTLQSGFTFLYPDLDSALAELLS
ncbi:epimerase family protein SDR39U1-like isoform X2 [Lithobates pipiens]